MEKEVIWLSGIIDKIIYDNKKGFMIFLLNMEKGKIVVKGEFLKISQGISIRVLGSYNIDKKYGKQFSAVSYQFVVPENISSWQKWLGSGIIKGVRKKNAKKIIDFFGSDTMNVLDGHPEQLGKVPGISLRQATIICNEFQNHTKNSEILLSLCNYGVPIQLAKKIINKYKGKTLLQLKLNPYKVVADVSSVGFKTIDPVALQMGVEERSPYRIHSAFLYLVKKAELEGHVYLPEKTLMERTSRLLNLPTGLLKNSLFDSDLVRVKEGNDMIVYSPQRYKEEVDIAKRLLIMVLQGEKEVSLEEVEELEKCKRMINEEQAAAVIQSLKGSLMVLTGGPGTGKTFTTNLIIRFLEERKCTVLLAAPTGKAAKRMEESTGRKSQTIHRLLEYTEGVFQRNESNPLDADVVLIDESSMIDQTLIHALLKALPPKCQLILVGDKNQLPSVGAGRILADIIASGICPVVELKKIYRQSEESYIAEAAHGILDGKVPYPWKKDKKIKDFYFIPVAGPDKEKAADIVAQYAGDKIPAFCKTDVQVLTMTRIRATGCEQLNLKIKSILNPSDGIKKEYKNFTEGDQVMQIKNNYDLVRTYPDGVKSCGVFNGDTGRIIEMGDEFIEIEMDDGSVVSYAYEDMDQVELSYAITTHKSQGSEYAVALIPIFDFIPTLTDRQLIYTAITRAKEMVVMIGDYKILQMMIKNTRSVRRNTRLRKLLEKGNGKAKICKQEQTMAV